MSRFLPFVLASLALAVAGTPSFSAEWKPSEKIVTYPITGATGMQLYLSIGDKGPVVGGGVRTIAHTTFKLLWSRDYQRRGTACVLASARPSLTITYTLPKPDGRLAPALKARWDTFMAGIRKHEAVHGVHIREMTREIERFSLGLEVQNDPDCKKIRADVLAKVKSLEAGRIAQDAEFDRVEMSDGGNVQRLILALVDR